MGLSGIQTLAISLNLVLILRYSYSNRLFYQVALEPPIFSNPRRFDLINSLWSNRLCLKNIFIFRLTKFDNKSDHIFTFYYLSCLPYPLSTFIWHCKRSISSSNLYVICPKFYFFHCFFPFFRRFFGNASNGTSLIIDASKEYSF